MSISSANFCATSGERAALVSSTLMRSTIGRGVPAGGKRLLQKARGYRATIVSGAVTYRDGEATGALPGKLVRGAQA